MIEEIVLLCLLGLAFGSGLELASRKFAVRVDERIEKIRGLLPGLNCGACGFGGCDDFAAALVGGSSLINACKQIAPAERREIGGILGIEVKEEKPEVAVVACTGESKVAFEYRGVKGCTAAANLMGGFLECKYGCLGFGDCARACPSGAIKVENRRAAVDDGSCTGCGICVNVCPRGLIKLFPRDAKVLRMCNSPERGKIVASVCEKGCIACGLCERACSIKAIKMENNLPVIDQELCNGCGDCVKACPRGVLRLLSPRDQEPIGESSPRGRVPAGNPINQT